MESIFIEENGISYKLDQKNFTCEIVSSQGAQGTLYIPRSIIYQSKAYLIVSIKKHSFKKNVLINTIIFPDDSELHTIESKAFTNSTIQSITIPSKVINLAEGWCKSTPELTQILISPNNPHFTYLDNEHKIIISKKNSDDFDTIIFASRDIKNVFIPANIKHICSYSFMGCTNINKFKIDEKSQLTSIGKFAFYDTTIKNFMITSNVKELGEGFILVFGDLEIRLSSENKNFVYLDNEKKIIVGKMNENDEKHNVIIFADREIEKAYIPSYIKCIGSFSFYQCETLK